MRTVAIWADGKPVREVDADMFADADAAMTDQWICDVRQFTFVKAEEYSGGPVVPESPEVRQARLDAEACALASSNAAPRPKPESPVVAAVKAFGAGMAVFGTIWVMGLAGQFAGGWPL